MATIRIRRFDPTTVKSNRITFLIGKRHTGKSVLMKDLLSYMPKPDFVLAMAPTDDTLKMFREFLPNGCIYDHFSQDKLERTMSLQRELISRGKTRSVLIILDDCMYQKGVMKSVAMRNLFFNGRHLNVGLICAAQYLVDISPDLRSNIDYLFTMRENTIANRVKLHKFFFGQFAKFEEFDRVMTACTQNYSALVMDATVASTQAADTIFWYKAKTDVEPFRLGRDVFWALSRRCGRSDDDIRRTQSKQFEIETATAEALAMGAQPASAGSKRITVVQTEDEHGKIVTSCT
jgi:hypothetical protein